LQNHRDYDVDSFAAAASLFFDTRGATLKNSIRL
jgi:hypothetical protein